MSRDEIEALIEVSRAELRHPREQARYLLRSALGLPAGSDQADQQRKAHEEVDIPQASKANPPVGSGGGVKLSLEAPGDGRRHMGT